MKYLLYRLLVPFHTLTVSVYPLTIPIIIVINIIILLYFFPSSYGFQK